MCMIKARLYWSSDLLSNRADVVLVWIVSVYVYIWFWPINQLLKSVGSSKRSGQAWECVFRLAPNNNNTLARYMCWGFDIIINASLLCKITTVCTTSCIVVSPLYQWNQVRMSKNLSPFQYMVRKLIHTLSYSMGSTLIHLRPLLNGWKQNWYALWDSFSSSKKILVIILLE